MKSIAGIYDLQDYGFTPLTGEACSLGMRILVDMTEQGCELFCECYGLPRVEKQFNDNWNPGSIASVMLPYDAWGAIGVFALLGAGHHTVLKTAAGTLLGLKGGESYRSGYGDQPARFNPGTGASEMDWPICYGKVVRSYGPGPNPHVGTRNVHAMSGRVS